MRNWLKTASLCMLAAFAFAACGCGEQTTASKAKKALATKNIPILDYLTEPFDPTVTKLPPGFRGCDITAIWECLEPEIGKYEKQEDYEQRIANFKNSLSDSKTLLGNIKYTSTLAFTLHSYSLRSDSSARGNDETLLAIYDEDYNVLECSVYPYYVHTTCGGMELQSCLTRLGVEERDFFFGQKEKVYKDTHEFAGIMFNYSGDKLTWRLLNISQETAEELQEVIGVVCVCKLKFGEEALFEFTKSDSLPYKSESEKKYVSTETKTSKKAVWVTEPEFWLYNIETGEIYAKYSLEESVNGAAKEIGDLTIENDEKTATPVLENRPTKEEVIRVIKGEANETREESSNKSPETPERKTEESSETLVYATEPFNPGWETLPPNYYGHDPEAIYKAVDALVDESKWKKDEFEKTTDYQKRVDNFWQELQDKTLVGDVNFASTLAFAFTEEARPAASLTENVTLQSAYDADKETLALSAFAGLEVDHPVSYSKKLCGLCFQTRRAIRETKVGVAFTESSISANLTLTLCAVAPSVARELSGKLGVLCVCQLAWREEDDVLWPKSCYKEDDGKALWTTEPVFWLYNVETGEVLAKFSLDEVKRERGKEIGDISVNKLGWDNRTGETADELRARISAEKGEKPEELARKLVEKIERESLKAAEKAKRETERKAREAESEAKQAAADVAKERRRAAEFWENGNKRLENRLAAVKKLTPSRDVDAPLTIAVPGDCATLAEALDEAAKAPYDGPIPRIVLDAGEYDASGLTLKTFVDVQSASGKPEDVVLSVDAASPITVDGETVASFDGVTLRQVGGGAKNGACVEVKRGIALLFGCVLDGKNGAKSATGVKAVGLKSAAVFGKCRATSFSLSALHVEDGAFAWAVESVFGPKNRFGASSKAARLEAEKCEFRGNETALYFRGIATGGAQGNVYAENKRDAQILDGAKVEVDAPNVDAGK